MAFRRFAASFVVGLAIFLAIPLSCESHQASTIHNQTSAASNTTQNNQQCWYASPEWALVIVGIVTFILIGYQARETARATKTMQENTKAFLAENRPWMLLSRDETFTKIYEPYLKPIGKVPPQEHREVSCPFVIRNYGKSPAQILAFNTELLIGDSKYMPPLANVFNTVSVSAYPYVFPQGESERHYAFIEPQRSATEEEEREILFEGKKFIWLCGLIRYRNPLEQTRGTSTVHETTFCYVYTAWERPSARTWIPSGPDEYNKAT